MKTFSKAQAFLSCRNSLLSPPRSIVHHPLSRVLNNQGTFRTMSSAVAKRLEGKTIVVTGASSGIGRSTAQEFARTSPKNLKLVLTARRIDVLQELAAEINKEVGEGVKVLPVKLDVSNPDEVRNFVGNLPEEFRDIDVLVNNAYVLQLSQDLCCMLIFCPQAAWSKVSLKLPRSRRMILMSCFRPT